jgi:hypothetical protein
METKKANIINVMIEKDGTHGFVMASPAQMREHVLYVVSTVKSLSSRLMLSVNLQRSGAEDGNTP